MLDAQQHLGRRARSHHAGDKQQRGARQQARDVRDEAQMLDTVTFDEGGRASLKASAQRNLRKTELQHLVASARREGGAANRTGGSGA